MTWKLLQGDVLDKLSEIETGTVQTCVTSPPYWNLRNYGIDGQIGLERTPEEYVEKMVQVFREVKRVLRDDGTLWLNLGDSYNNTSGFSRASPEYFREGRVGGSADKKAFKHSVIKTKDLCGIPWRVAFALQADGWYLRSAMPWLKGSAMPESVTDRPTSAVEYFFLLTKSERYFYDIEATRMKGSIPAGTRAAKGSGERKSQAGVNARPPEYKEYSGTRNRRNSDWFMDSIRDILEGKSGTLLHDENNIPTAIFCNPQPYKEAHYATFSPRLITPMILAGTSPRACEICGAPWERVVERQAGVSKECPKTQAAHEARGGTGKPVGTVGKSGSGRIDGYSITLGWRPTCTCKNEGTGRCIVLDPFVGSGTTLWVAERFGRDSIGIELSPEYCELINKRMSNRQMTLFERGADL